MSDHGKLLERMDGYKSKWIGSALIADAAAALRESQDELDALKAILRTRHSRYCPAGFGESLFPGKNHDEQCTCGLKAALVGDSDEADACDLYDPCPECGTQLEAQPGGGVACPAKGCGYWFCF